VARENHGKPEAAALEIARDPVAYGLCRTRLERALQASCDSTEPWPARVVVGIAAVLRFAAGDPIAARALTLATAHRCVQEISFREMVDRLAALLGEGAPSTHDPERTARAVVLRIARQILLQLERRPASEVIEIAPELVVFALVPYLEFGEAQRWAGKVVF
jgi:hypothetical protein